MYHQHAHSDLSLGCGVEGVVARPLGCRVRARHPSEGATISVQGIWWDCWCCAGRGARCARLRRPLPSWWGLWCIIQGLGARGSCWCRVGPNLNRVHGRSLMSCPVGRFGVRWARTFSSVKMVKLHSQQVFSHRVVELCICTVVQLQSRRVVHLYSFTVVQLHRCTNVQL